MYGAYIPVFKAERWPSLAGWSVLSCKILLDLCLHGLHVPNRPVEGGDPVGDVLPAVPLLLHGVGLRHLVLQDMRIFLKHYKVQGGAARGGLSVVDSDLVVCSIACSARFPPALAKWGTPSVLLI